jgi:NDP-sugar pyrophosphorylase family protein
MESNKKHKAVILAAGKGTRMRELSIDTPKPLLKVRGKTLLQHKIEMLPESVDEVIIIVGYLKDKITAELGDMCEGRKITYVMQDELLGTAHSLWMAKDLLKNEERFLVMMGDDLYSKRDMQECLKYEYSILVRDTDSLKDKAKVIFDGEGHIQDIIEKYQVDEAGFVCSGMYSITPKIFDYEMVKLPNGEYGLPQTILAMKNDVNIKAVEASFWIQITAPEDLVIAENHLAL